MKRARLDSLSHWRARLATVCAALLLTACAGTPSVPEWKLRSSAALDRATQAMLAGETRRAQGDFKEAFAQIARSGQPALMARAHLLKCAVQVASLDFMGCSEFDVRRIDASPEDRAYADYLEGALKPADLPKLAAQHRPFVSAAALATSTSSTTSTGSTNSSSSATSISLAALLGAFKSESDPLTRLVAASVLLRTGQVSPEVIAVAVETASAQGWRYPLAAWLRAQIRLAEKSGNKALAQEAQRRLDVVLAKKFVP